MSHCGDLVQFELGYAPMLSFLPFVWGMRWRVAGVVFLFVCLLISFVHAALFRGGRVLDGAGGRERRRH